MNRQLATPITQPVGILHQLATPTLARPDHHISHRIEALFFRQSPEVGLKTPLMGMVTAAMLEPSLR